MTQDHSSYGACLRAAGLRVGYAKSAAGLDATAEKNVHKELALYRDARAAGVQPAGTTAAAVRTAMDLSERAGAAYDATNQTFKNGAHYSPKTDKIVSF